MAALLVEAAGAIIFSKTGKAIMGELVSGALGWAGGEIISQAASALGYGGDEMKDIENKVDEALKKLEEIQSSLEERSEKIQTSIQHLALDTKMDLVQTYVNNINVLYNDYSVAMVALAKATKATPFNKEDVALAQKQCKSYAKKVRREITENIEQIHTRLQGKGQILDQLHTFQVQQHNDLYAHFCNLRLVLSTYWVVQARAIVLLNYARDDLPEFHSNAAAAIASCETHVQDQQNFFTTLIPEENQTFINRLCTPRVFAVAGSSSWPPTPNQPPVYYISITSMHSNWDIAPGSVSDREMGIDSWVCADFVNKKHVFQANLSRYCDDLAKRGDPTGEQTWDIYTPEWSRAFKNFRLSGGWGPNGAVKSLRGIPGDKWKLLNCSEGGCMLQWQDPHGKDAKDKSQLYVGGDNQLYLTKDIDDPPDTRRWRIEIHEGGQDFDKSMWQWGQDRSERLKAWEMRNGGLAVIEAAAKASTLHRLDAGQQLLAGEWLSSPNSIYSLRYQTDGNLVLYDRNNGIWSSGTQDQEAGYLAMQKDGNCVICGRRGQQIWETGTKGIENPTSAYLEVLDNGFWEIRTNATKRVKWNSEHKRVEWG